MNNFSDLHVHQSKATSQIMETLHDGKLFKTLAYINGKWVCGDEEKPVINPHDNSIAGYFTQLNHRQINQAIDCADNAFQPWRKLQAKQRAEYLHRWYDEIIKAKRDLAHLMVIEQGKLLSEAEGEIEYGASFIRWFAEEAQRSYGETIPSHIDNAQLMTFREPIGVAALITPWNFPSAMITRKAAAAMAIGCTVLIKPASETPFSALALAELAERAGIPAGVFNVITGNAQTISTLFCDSDKVKALSFTGSTHVGKLLLEKAAHTVKKCSMELGGNAPFIVLPDMDAEQAAQAAANARFQTSGQDCLAANRIFVPETLHPAFIARFAEIVEQQVMGSGLTPTSTNGPLINRTTVSAAQELIADAISKGAHIEAQAKVPSTGNYFPATLLTQVTPAMRVYREETFCPIAPVISYRSLEQVIEMSNDTEYGLAAYVYGHDIHQIWQCMRGLEFGMVSVNSIKMTGPPIPFGGMKQSGLGREGSKHGFDDFSEVKYCCLGALPTVSGS